MSEKYTKKEHYVPQFYLENFSDDTGQVWVYDRIGGSCFRQTPKNICYQEDLYETKTEDMNPAIGEYILRNQIEKDLAQRERIWSDLLKTVVRTCRINVGTSALICSFQQKEELARFVANLILRNPWSMNYAGLEEITAAKQLPETKLYEQLFSMLEFGSIDSVLRYINLYNHLNDEYGNQSLLARDLLEMNMCFLYNEADNYVTSCHPVFCGIRGEVNTLTDVILPLSTDIMVIFGFNKTSRKYRNHIGINDHFSVLMKFLYINAFPKEKDRFIIAKRKEDLVGCDNPQTLLDCITDL